MILVRLVKTGKQTSHTEVIQPDVSAVPTTFTGCDTWPVRTHISCWQCGLQFKTTPRFVPTRMNINGDDISFYTMGIFCSFSCTYSYIIKQFECEPITRDIYIKHLRILYFIIFGIEKQSFLCAPSFTICVKYGGMTSEESYLNMCIAYDMSKSIMDVCTDTHIITKGVAFRQNIPIKRTMKECAHLFAYSPRICESESEWSITVDKGPK